MKSVPQRIMHHHSCAGGTDCQDLKQINKYVRKRTREEKLWNNKKKDSKKKCNHYKMKNHEEKDFCKKKEA